MMINPSIEQLTQGKFNRYALVIATAKCARIVTDEYVKQREEAEKLARSIDGKTVNVVAQGGSDGRLYGSVTAKDIADAYKKQLGVEIDKRKLQLDEPIRAFGVYTVEVKIYNGINATVKVAVVGK